MTQSGGHRGLVLRRRPGRYTRTPQQELFAQACQECGIRKGMSKAELQEAMAVCIPEFFRRKRNERNEDLQP